MPLHVLVSYCLLLLWRSEAALGHGAVCLEGTFPGGGDTGFPTLMWHHGCVLAVRGAGGEPTGLGSRTCTCVKEFDRHVVRSIEPKIINRGRGNVREAVG